MDYPVHLRCLAAVVSGYVMQSLKMELVLEDSKQQTELYKQMMPFFQLKNCE